DIQRICRGAETKSGWPESGVAERREDRFGSADIGPASREGALLLPAGGARRGDGCNWRGSSEVWRRSRQRLLRATDHLYWTSGISALREGRNLRAGVSHRAVRFGRGSRRHG